MTSPGLQLIDQDLFDAVALRARASERLRMNFNLHQESDLVQRFLNVMQPGTYVRPHRHCRPGTGEGFECFVVLQGSIGVLLFDANGTCLRQERLDASRSRSRPSARRGPLSLARGPRPRFGDF